MVRFIARGWWFPVGITVALCACRFDESGQGAGVAVGRGDAGAGEGLVAGGGGSAGSAISGGASGSGGSVGSPTAGQAGATSTPASDAAGPVDAVPPTGDPPADASPPPVTPPAADAASDPPVATPDVTAPPPSTPPAAPGPVGHWRFDEGSGAVAGDASGSENTGTLLGGPAFVANGFPQAKFPNAGALTFDGDDDQVVAGINRIPAPQAPKTISLWFRPPVLSVGSRAFISLTNRSVSCGIHIGTKSALIAAWKWGGDMLVSRVSPPGASWHHVLYTFDGVGHTLRVDGGPPEFSNLPTQSCPLTHLVIGNYEGGGNHFQGTLDDVRIYDRVVTEVEARALADGREAP